MVGAPGDRRQLPGRHHALRVAVAVLRADGDGEGVRRASTMRKFLKYELEAYLRGRGGERVEELPLMRVENQGYIHYRKGSLVMYALRDCIGEEALNARPRPLRPRQEVPGAALHDDPRVHGLPARGGAGGQAGPAEGPLRGDHPLREPRRQREPGRKRARREVRGATRGREREVPRLGLGRRDEPRRWTTGWTSASSARRERATPPEGKVLLLEKRRLAAPKETFTLVVDEPPVKAGVDPFNKLIDRSPENNLVAAAGAGGQARDDAAGDPARPTWAGALAVGPEPRLFVGTRSPRARANLDRHVRGHREETQEPTAPYVSPASARAGRGPEPPLPARRRARPGRHGDRLPGHRSRAAARGGGQGAARDLVFARSPRSACCAKRGPRPA